MTEVNGVCKWFDDVKGYGFVRLSDGRDCFVHHSDIDMDGHRTLRDGDSVTLDVEQRPKGLTAINVRRVYA